MFNSVLIVCVGNICRSPTAECLLRQLLAEKKSNIQVSSAGLGALVDHPATSEAAELAQAIGVDLSQHRAHQLTRDMLHHNDLVLVMEQQHIQHIEAMAPESRGKVHLLGRWHHNIEIPDPYKKGSSAYKLALELIQASTQAWLPYLK